MGVGSVPADKGIKMMDRPRWLQLLFVLLMGVSASAATQTVEEGIELYRTGQYESAVSALSAILDQEAADNGSARAYLGLSLLELGRIQEAQLELEKAAAEPQLERAQKAAAEPQLERAQIGLARAYTEQRRFNEAAAALRRAEQINPQSVDLFYYRGLLNLAQNQFDSSARDLERTLELDPTRTRAHYYAGLAYNGLRRPDRMVTHFQTFLTLEPNAPEGARIRSLLRAVQ